MSLVLNDSDNPKLRPETRAKVLETMRRMNYQPSSLGRALSSNKSNTIGVISGHWTGLLSHQYFGTLVNSILEQSIELRKTVALYHGQAWKDETTGLPLFGGGKCDGALVLMAGEQNELVHALQQSRIPFVTINSGVHVDGVNSVDVDNFEVGHLATRYLISLGHSRIGCLMDGFQQFSLDRLAGYRLALAEAGLKYDEDLVTSGYFSDDQEKYIYAQPVAPDATALFVTTDGLAVNTIQVMKDEGRRIPEEMSIVGVNNTWDGIVCNPSLTTIAQPFREMVSEALRILMARMDVVAAPTEHVDLSTKIIVRESTAALPKRTCAAHFAGNI